MARVVITTLLLLCVISVVAAQYPVALFQRQGDGSCQDFVLNTCTACTNNCGETNYFRCDGDGDDIDCIVSRRSDCASYDSYTYVHHEDCGQLGACEIGYQLEFTVDFAVDSTSTLVAYSEPHGRDSYVQMSGKTAATQGHVANVLYESSGDQVRFETAFNKTTYLTSAGTCDFGELCSSGVLNYRANILPLTNLTEPELQGTRVEIHTDGLLGFKNADSATTSTFTVLMGDELNIGSDELSEVVLEAVVRGETVVLSNLVLGRADGNKPILYFEVQTASGINEYDYVTCEWEGRYESSEEWYANSPFTGSVLWYEDAVAVEERAVATPTPAASHSASHSASASVSSSRTLSNSASRSRMTSPSATRSRSLSQSRQCSPFYIEPTKGSSDDEYVRCSLDRLFDSNEFFSYGGFGSFASFALVRARPLSNLMSALNSLASIFRL